MAARRRIEYARRVGARWLPGATLTLAATVALLPTATAAGLTSMPLPTGRFVLADTGTLDGAAIVQVACTWLALFALCFWAGGVMWEAWVLPPAATADDDLAASVGSAARRFRTLAPYALGLAFMADFGAIRFGNFWWLRQLVIAAALVAAIQTARRGAAVSAGLAVPAGGHSATRPTAHDWRGELAATLRDVGTLPDRIVLGWRRLRPRGRLDVALGAALIVAFALSGQATGVPASMTGYAFFLDVLQLLAMAVWLGGLFYLAVVLIPVTHRLAAARRARLLALGLHEFGPLALVAGVLLVIAVALNAKIRLSSAQQMLTTTYGRTCVVELELFLIMVAVSAYLALYLRPRLALELDTEATGARLSSGTMVAGARVEMSIPTRGASGATATRTATRGRQATVGGQPPSGPREPDGQEKPPSPRAESLEERIRDWLRRQALLGGAVLVCVALLGIFAGSLMPAATVPSSAASATPTPYSSQRTAAGYTFNLNVTPDRFGNNTFTVTVKDSGGQPLTGATVIITLTSTDMDMGVEKPQLQPVAGKPGVYSAQNTITMAGNWQVVLDVTPAGAQSPIETTFRFAASY